MDWTEYMKSRDAVLLSGDIERLREHMERFDVPGRENASDRVLEITLHKARVHWRDCPPKLLKESVWWLLEREYSLDLE